MEFYLKFSFLFSFVTFLESIRHFYCILLILFQQYVHYGYSLSLLLSKRSGNIWLDKIEVDVSKMQQYFEDSDIYIYEKKNLYYYL